ncbi:MAG: hypothetical protein U0670_21390 [Anaerolineae bacterium]
MPYQLGWIVPKRVILTQFSGNISKDELIRYAMQMQREISSGDSPVYHISDSLNLGKVELSLGAVQKLIRTLPSFKALSWQVDINRPGLNTMLAALGSQFAGVRTRTFATQTEAVAFLKSVDETLERAVWSDTPTPVDTL